MLEEFKRVMMASFEMSGLGKMRYFLGMEISQEKNGVFYAQKKYTEDLLKRFNMTGCKPVATPLIPNEKLRKDDDGKKVDASTYRSLVGSLLYLRNTIPGILFATSLLLRFMQSPSQIHFGTAKRILRYLQGAINFGIWNEKTSSTKLVGFTDSDWAGSSNDMRSTSGYCFTVGSAMFFWSSRRQGNVAQSTAKTEYVATAGYTNQAIWLRRVLEDMGEKQLGSTQIFCDNKSAITIAKDPVQHS
ncbi:hypothetical protein F2P56_003932 [Juglans regia]|uniref:Reverse transcriptase Ty1/copia-type domain-containing protein n=1 Tax=Juglans regia TaxID=51240 RepID=A0A833Y7A7_JUGRE|nr:hypothetical protein F2P56_003932 [Juglans regia]